MNLSELRAKIKNVTDYLPENDEYDIQIDELVNDAYQRIWTGKRWTFAQKKTYINTYPDITHESTGMVANVTDGQRQIIFPAGLVPGLQGNEEIYEGQIIEIQGREYTIDQISGMATQAIRVREPLRATTTVADDTWIIKHRYYTLPSNTIELLSVSNRDVPNGVPGITTKLACIDAPYEESANIREDSTSTYADSYILTPPTIVAAAEKLNVVVEEDGDPGAGDIPNSYWIEFCWAFYWDGGHIGPLSESFTAQTDKGGQGGSPLLRLYPVSADNRSIQSPPYVAVTDVERNPYEGYRKVFFYNSNYDHINGTRLGLPTWRMITNKDEHTPFLAEDEDDNITIRWMSELHQGNPRYEEHDGQHQRIRPYPRPQSTTNYEEHDENPERQFSQLETRYYYKPNLLTLNTDTPEMPYEMHSCIVNAALEHVFIKNGNASMAQLYTKRLAEDMKRLERRYTDRVDVQYQRGSFHSGQRAIRFDTASLKMKS